VGSQTFSFRFYILLVGYRLVRCIYECSRISHTAVGKIKMCIFYCISNSEPRHISRILGRRFALIFMANKYLDIGINMGPVSSVAMLLDDNKSNRIILPHATWETFIARRANIEQLLQSSAPSSLLF